MVNYLNIVLGSKRLKLRPLQLNDADKVVANFTKEITRYMCPSAPKSQQDIHNFIIQSRSQMSSQNELMMAIMKNDKTNEFLGIASIHNTNSDSPELGIWLKQKAHGYKYGVEAIKLLKEWAEINLNYKYLKYPVDKRNIASKKIAERLGGIVKDQYLKTSEDGTILDELEYRLYRT